MYVKGLVDYNKIIKLMKFLYIFMFLLRDKKCLRFFIFIVNKKKFIFFMLYNFKFVFNG